MLGFFCLALSMACSRGYMPPNKVSAAIKTADTSFVDALDLVYKIAEEKGMRVIADLNMEGGALYEKHSLEEVKIGYKKHIPLFYKRYGQYKSFWGWYLNNELNPLRPGEVKNSSFWRSAWKTAVDECKKVAPQSVVTISPFFIVDQNKYRGHPYLEPIGYEQWWAKTLKETGIDILMLQDSGAEHLGFFTLEDRRPFFQAFKNACDQAGSQFWVNIETGEVDAKDWADAVQMEKSNTQKWVYTSTDWLAKKQALAAEFTHNLVNWGYYPFMVPTDSKGPFLTDAALADKALRTANYNSYKNWYDHIKSRSSATTTMRGTLWWLLNNYDDFSKAELEALLRNQIDKQAAIGFDILWILNAAGSMQRAIDKGL